jgi:SAM-dependent methyltransferase
MKGERSMVQEKKLTTQRLMEMGFAFRQSGTIAAALDFELFTRISEGANKPSEVAEKIGIPAEATERLMIACAAMKLLEKKGDGYINAPDVEKYFVKTNRTYFGDWLKWTIKRDYDVWKNLSDRLRPPRRGYYAMKDDPQAAREFTTAGYNSAISMAHKLAKEFNFSDYKLFLDLGGGSGAYSIAAAQRHPNLSAIVFDFPNVCRVADEFIAQGGVSDRVKTRHGDFYRDELPRGADLISFITPLQSYDKDEVQFLLKKAFDAVEPGGGIIVLEYMLDDDKTGPLEPAFVHLVGITSQTSPGHVNTSGALCEYLENAGFVDTEASWFVPGQVGKVIAKKPK